MGCLAVLQPRPRTLATRGPTGKARLENRCQLLGNC